MVTRQAHNLEIRGSIPLSATILIIEVKNERAKN